MAYEQSFVYEQAGEKLLHFVPELQDAYQRELLHWGAERPGPHVLYDEILNPYINELLAADRGGADVALKRVFDFLEHLASADDDRLPDLVAVTICQPLLADHVQLNRARSYMGPATLRILNKAQHR